MGRDWGSGQESHWGNQGRWAHCAVYRHQGCSQGLGLCGSESQPNVATFHSWPKSGQPRSTATDQLGLRKANGF